MANRLLFESDVIRAVDKHTSNDKLDNDISCILEEVKTATVELPSILLENKVENKQVQKQKQMEKCGFLSLHCYPQRRHLH